MENYFNYFTEIEEQFQRRRGTGLLLSTLDWALIETWKDAGIPLEAVLRGIDTTFDHYERRPSKTKKINGLAWCAQEVLAAAEDMKEAAVGTRRSANAGVGLEVQDIARFFRDNSQKLRRATIPEQAQTITQECATTLDELAEGVESANAPLRLEDMERRLTILEEKLLAALTVMTSEATLVAIRADAEREIAPYRSKMPAAQIQQLLKQFTAKRLLEQAGIPRLSLFYL